MPRASLFAQSIDLLSWKCERADPAARERTAFYIAEIQKDESKCPRLDILNKMAYLPRFDLKRVALKLERFRSILLII